MKKFMEIILYIGLFLIIGIVVLPRLHSFRKSRKVFDKAYSSFFVDEINDVIIEEGNLDKSTSIKLLNKMYLCDPIPDENHIFFEDVVEKGDSIIKDADADFFVLKKKNKKRFKFKCINRREGSGSN